MNFLPQKEKDSHYNVVQIELSFVSTGRDSDKPERDINISLLSSCMHKVRTVTYPNKKIIQILTTCYMSRAESELDLTP